MRRLLCFIMLPLLIGSARGQTAYSYRYWFDAGDSVVYSGSATGEAVVELDIGALKKGALHAIHIQAHDARNKWGAAHTSYFFYTRGGTQGTTGRYWFDQEETRRTVSTVSGVLNLDVASLGCGVHALHLQMYDADGDASPVQTAYFYKGEKGATARYWFDNEKTMKAATTIDGTLELDIESLGCGVHAVHFQSFSAKGVASPVHTAYFYKGATGTKARYWFDNEKTMQVAATVSGMLDLDVSHLDHGIHALHVQAFSDNGEASPVETSYFYKKDDALSCRLWIDDKKSAAKTFSLNEENIELDAEDLTPGWHELHVYVLNAAGILQAEKTVKFHVFDPDGITLVEAFTDDDAFYDVAGRRLPKMQKGIIIKGGKKILVK